MPYRRYKKSTRKYPKYSRRYRRDRGRTYPTRYTKSKIGLQLNTHRFTRRVQLYGHSGAMVNIPIQTNTGAGGGYAGIAFNFYLNQLPNYTEFSSLFDSYKITKVKMHITCLTAINTNADFQTYGIGLPKLYYVHDEDDVTAPPSSQTGLNDMMERVKTRYYSFTPNRNTVTVTIRPNLLAETYKSAVSTAYAPVYNKWVDMADPNTPYYGVKMMFYTPSVNNVLPGTAFHAFQIDAVYYISCKDVR